MQVEFTSSFWATIVEHFDEVRGPLGEPSLRDFQQFDLPTIRSEISTNWDHLYQLNGRRFASVLGLLKPLYIVACEPIGDAKVGAFHIDIDEDFKFNE